MNLALILAVAFALTSRQSFDAAKRLYDDGNWSEALTAFQQFERDQPFSTSLPRVMQFEGWCLLKLQRYFEAAERFHELQTKFPKHQLRPQAMLGEASARLGLGDFASADTILRRVRDSYHDDPTVSHDADYIGERLAERKFFASIQTLLAKRQFDQVIVESEKFRQQYPKSLLIGNIAFLDAEAMFGQKQYSQALARYLELQNNLKDPQLIETTEFRIAACYHSLKQYDKARDAFTAFVQRFKESALAPEALFLLGRSHCETTPPNFAEAARAFAQIRKNFPKSERVPDANAALAEIAAQQRQDTAARAAPLTRAIQSALAEKHYARAIAAAEKLASERDELPAESYVAIGTVMLKTERYAEARDAFEKAHVDLGIGQACLGLQNYDAAERAFKKALTTDLQNLDAKLGLGRVYEARGNVKEAAAMYDPVWREGRGDEANEAAFRVGMIAFRENDFKTALPMLTRLLFATGPMAEEAAFRIAQCHEALRHLEQARSGYQAYLRRFPNGAFILEARTQLAKLS